jgi:DNA adenine methylase
MTTLMTANTSIYQSSLPIDKAKPFLKWVGGKQQLLSQYEPFFPPTVQRYFEAFVGGGALFFHFWNTGRLPNEVFLLDNNAELINAYQVVRDRVDELIKLLALHEQLHNREYYYEIRSLDRKGASLGAVERAARMLYLNRTCYNGLYRVNRRAQFNVPLGSYKNPKVLHEETLRTASLALQGVAIETRDFRTIVDLARAGDFIYFDPPYDPVSKTASFTSYTANNFRDQEQLQLAQVFSSLSEKGCLCMLSNSYTPLILELYQNYHIAVVEANRAINSNGNGRGGIREVVILNY